MAAALYKMDDTFVLDVRGPDEVATGTLKKAKHITHTDIEAHSAELPASKDTNIVVFCRSGKRAGIAQETLAKLGYTNVTNAGGYDAIKQWDE